MTHLTAHDISCSRDDRLLFSNLSFELAAGELLLLEGHNGSGKTSLLNILSGLVAPDDGDVLWCQHSIYGDMQNYHTNLAYLGHRNALKTELSVEENFRFIQDMHNSADSSDIQQQLGQVGLAGYQDVQVKHLSAGQQRRLALTRLLLHPGKIWILDEPFTSLDSHAIETIQNLFLEKINAGGIVIVSTHHKLQFDQHTIKHINLSA